jgi:hypothetical protein
MVEVESSEKPETPKWKKWLVRLIFWGFIIFAIIKWPQGVGAVLAGGAILLLALIFWIKYKIRKWLKPLENFKLFYPELTLIGQEKVSWNHPEAMEKQIEELRTSGFRQIGSYKLQEMNAANIFAALNEKEAIYAAVYDLPRVDVMLDLVTIYEDNTTFTCSNSEIAGFLQRPPGKLVERHPGLGAEELLRELLKNRPDKPRLAVKPEDFVPRFERYHKELMEWQHIHAESVEKLNRELREEFLAKANWSAIEWDRKQNRVVIIHDQMPENEVVDAYRSWLPDCGDEQEDGRNQQIENIAHESPRLAAFERMIREVPHHPPFEKIVELTSPVPACVYLSPERPQEKEDEE